MAMARPKKSIDYNADSATIRRYFHDAMALKRSQKNKSSEISTLNVLNAGRRRRSRSAVVFCRIANMPPAKRALHLTLSDLYRQVLASELEDPAQEDRAAIPFADAKAA
jgi:hypothetical protein